LDVDPLSIAAGLVWNRACNISIGSSGRGFPSPPWERLSRLWFAWSPAHSWGARCLVW